MDADRLVVAHASMHRHLTGVIVELVVDEQVARNEQHDGKAVDGMSYLFHIAISVSS